MGRRAKEPRYFPSREAYFIQIAGKQTLLARGAKDDAAVKKLAWKNFFALMAINAAHTDGDESPFYAIANSYLHWIRNNRKPNTYRKVFMFIQSFVNKHGKILIRDLQVRHVEEWLEEKAEGLYSEKQKKHLCWNVTSRRIGIVVLEACLNWAEKRKLISKNPVRGIEKPPKISRSMESVINEEQHLALLERNWKKQNKSFYYILVALWETGARPGELTGMTASNYKPDMGAWVIDIREGLSRKGHKTGHKGKRRIIYLTERLRHIVEKLNKEYPTGPIFKTSRGRPYCANLVVSRINKSKKSIDRKRQKRGELPIFTSTITAYSYRHKYVTDRLTAGVPPAYVASLLGTSVQMIEDHYSHLSDRSDALRQQVLDYERLQMGLPREPLPKNEVTDKLGILPHERANLRVFPEKAAV